jgi:hypothetical protein
MNHPGKLTPALTGGLIIGIFSSVPILNIGNCICCMWVISGGAFAAYLLHRQWPADVPFRYADGAAVGFLAGLFGALFGTLLGYALAAVGLEWNRHLFENWMRHTEDVPQEFEDIFHNFQTRGPFHPIFVFIGLMFSLVIDSIFATIGGILASAWIGKHRPPQQPTGTETPQA